MKVTKYTVLAPVAAIVKAGTPNEILIAVDGFEGPDGTDIVLTIDRVAGTVTRISTGETLSFATDKPGINRRPQMEIVESQTRIDREYHVYKVDPDDPFTWICDCEDFHHRRFGMAETCKHIGFAHSGHYKRLTK